MSELLLAGGIVLALLAVVANQIVTFFPRLGLTPLHRVQSVQAIAGALAIVLSGSGWLKERSPAALALLGATTLVVLGSPWLLNPRVGIVAVSNPKHAKVRDAHVRDDAGVLGIELGGETHAWPLELLVPHHIVNDRLGELPVLAAWCAACRSGVVYAAESVDRELTFEVSGVYRRNMIMRDRETRSLWQHATGEALVGPLAGTSLRPLGGERMTWGAWRRAHPTTTIAVDPGTRGLLPTWLLTRLLEVVTSRLPLPGLKRRDRRLPAREEVAGLVLEGAARAYPLSVLKRERRLADQLADRRIEIVYDAASDRVSASDTERHAPIPVERGWWLGWSEFHPETSVGGEWHTRRRGSRSS